MNNIRKLLTTLIFTAAFILLPCLAILPVQAEGTDDYIDYAGSDVAFNTVDGAGFGMFTAQDGTTCKIEGENVVIHFVPKNTTVYNGIHWGKITDAELTKDLSFNEDGTFDITLPKETACGHGIPVAPIKISDPTATTSKQYYLCVPKEAYLIEEELTVDNQVGMFKIVSAVLKEDADGKFIKFSLSGSGYHDLFKGTYDEAVANGDNRDNWIRGYQNDEGKWEFILRLDEGDSYIPLVAISYSYLTKYENGQNPLARAFYPRQITFDADAKSLLVEDYKNTFDLALTNNVKMFKPSAAAMTVLGGPNSNGYKVTMDLTMGSDSFSALFIGEKDDAAKEGAEIINLGEGNVFKDIPVEHIVTPGNPDSTVTILEEPVILSFYSASKQLWYERKATISKKDKTIVFDPADADYTAVDAAIASIPEDLSIYTEETAAAVTAARDAVVEGLNYKHQDEVDAMAAAINEAVAKLFTKEDQAAVDNAKQLIEDAKKDYPTAAEKQAAVTAAQAAFNALSEDLQAMIPDAEKAINEAQAAADTQKQAEDKAKEDSKDTPKTDTPKVGDTATVGKFVFKVASAKNATLIKPVKKTNKKVTIPTSVKIKGKSFQVTAIANNAFKNNKKLTKIVVPASVTTIGKNAFKGCAAAKSITIGKKVKTIGASAFFGCKKAKKLIIKGTAIKKFGKKAFAKTGIKKLIVSNKKKKAAYKKKLIKAGMSKKAK